MTVPPLHCTAPHYAAPFCNLFTQHCRLVSLIMCFHDALKAFLAAQLVARYFKMLTFWMVLQSAGLIHF